MSFAAESLLKPISMTTNGCLNSYTASKASFSRPHVSIPFRPIKLHISCSSASSIQLSLKSKEPTLKTSVMAAQQEEGIPVLLEEEGGGEFNWAESQDSDGGDTDGFEPLEEAKLYVGNVPYNVDSETLAQIFEGAGTVEIVEIIGDRQTGRSRGYGFVTMSTVEEADKAVEMFHRYDLNGRFLTVNKATRKGLRPPPRVSESRNNIYVGNLPWSAGDARLEQLFSEYGKVVSARVVSDRETGRSRGFGFVVLSSEAEMNDAIANLDGHNLDGRAIKVNVAAVRPARGGF